MLSPKLRASLACGLFLLAGPGLAQAPPAGKVAAPAATEASEGRRLDRLMGLCRAWNAAKYLHPTLWSSDLDWDAAFVTAATTVDGSSDTAAYRAVAAQMLGALGDSATKVAEAEPDEAAALPAAKAPSGPEASAQPELVRKLADGLLLVDLIGYQRAKGPYALYELGERLAAELPAARGAIVDLRVGPGESAYWSGAALIAAAPQLVPRRVEAPALRWIVRWGYEPQRGMSSGGYRSGLVTSAREEFAPAGEGGSWRLVFLVNERSWLSEVVQALVASGDAKLVSEGDLAPASALASVAVELGEGLVAHVRSQEQVGAPPAAVVVPRAASGGDAALAAARALLSGPWPEPPPSAPPADVPAVRRLENRYPRPALPPRGLRLLAGCRAWGVIHYFYPYLSLIGDWDAAVRQSLPALETAGDEAAYARALLVLMAHVADGHTTVSGNPGIQQVLGEALPHLAVRIVEDQVAVTAVDPALNGLAVGDVIVSVDGEPIARRIERLRPLTAASTELTLRTRAARRALAGPKDSTARLEVLGGNGKVRRVDVPRDSKFWQPPAPEDPPWKRLRPRIGYADLTRLQPEQVDPMLEELRDTDALVLDLRGYPNGTAWPLAARLNVRGAKIGAIFRRREVSGLDAEESESGYFFSQPLPEPRSWTYRGKVVMLLDERAISQSEHTALFLEQAAGVTFIGSPTAGANGDVTSFLLPGGVWVTFTGHDVRHADGRQLQRVGIQPDVPAAPTLRGLREGRDEVLERALAWLDEALAGKGGSPTSGTPPPPVRRRSGSAAP
jgi:C-terminal processing protease CtpA/Prc